MASFEYDIQVTMGDCDPAGIVYYPRVAEMVSKVIEAWFSEALDYGFHQMHLTERFSIPTVDIHLEFFAPSELSESIAFSLTLLTLKRRSFVAQVTGRHQGQLRIRSTSSLVFCRTSEDTGELKSTNIPQSLRERMYRYLSPTTQAASGTGPTNRQRS